MSLLYEIHSVAITLCGDNNIAGREIIGVIEATDSKGTVCIYKARKDRCKPVLADGTLYLTGPSRPINAPSIHLKVCLRDKQTGNLVSSGNYYMLPVPPIAWYNKPLCVPFRGTHGAATLYSTMFSSGVAVAVDAKILINTEGHQQKKAKNTGVEDNSKSRHAIHGTLYAWVGGEEKFYQRTLFNRSSDHPKSVVNDNVIRLSRRIIVVPEHSAVVIKADLCDETRAQVANGTLSFADKNDAECRLEMEDSAYIEGAIGRIEVKVTWQSAK